MGDLAADTAVRRVDDGLFAASLNRDWEIWGPMGGYVAAVALRAVGEVAPARVPATFSCHYLSVAQWGDVQVQVEPRRQGRGASSYRVEISQGEQPVLDAMVWAVTPGSGLEHDEATAPDVPKPEALSAMIDLVPRDEWPPYPFWNNVENKPTRVEPGWPPDGPRPATWQQWLRFTPTAAFADPWVDATRSVILIDLPGWPAAVNPHAWRREPYIAPTLDLNVAFHRPTGQYEWLLCDGAAPISTGGLLGWSARVWSPDGALHASGGGQCKYRRLPA